MVHPAVQCLVVDGLVKINRLNHIAIDIGAVIFCSSI
jgi:hypothetical protein